MSIALNKTASALLVTGHGTLKGVFVSTASGSPTVQFVDGVSNNDDVIDKATGVLTVSGAIVPAAHATSTVTSNATNVTDADTLTIGAVVYRFKDTMAAAFDVQIGASAAATLDNLKAAINLTGTDGVEYFAGTTAHAFVYASTNTNTTQVVVARVVGTASNTLSTVDSAVTLSWADTTLGGGTGTSDPGVVATAATVTVNGRVYTFVNELSETSGAVAVVDQVVWGGDTLTALDNFKVAINAGATAGTNYSTGTVVNAVVTATTNTDTAQTLESLLGGVVGNTYTTAETLTNGSFATPTLTGGLEVNLMMIEAFVGVAGTMYTFPDPAFAVGCYMRISGTAEVTAFVELY